MSDNGQTSDILRDRIAAAIAKADQDWCSDNNLHDDMADAVIEALGLKVEDSKTYTGGNSRFYFVEGQFDEPI